ncbi:MAG: hypothetical protein ACR2IV_20320 [Bryobacteraceae bacterium]
MIWVRIANLSTALCLALIIRLLLLRLHRVYRIFCLFLVSELSASLVADLKFLAPGSLPDYRIIWIVAQSVIWICTLWTVYALLDAVLTNLPGILGFSRKLLNGAFISAGILALLTAPPEYSVSGAAEFLDPIARAVSIGFVLDRVLSTVALLVLVSILGFLLWFPVEVSKNLIVFSTGFLVYFAAKTALLLTRSFWSHQSLNLVSNLIMFISCACYAYWAMFISRQGENVPVRVGHSWRVREQERLIGQLEAINAALLRTAVRR